MISYECFCSYVCVLYIFKILPLVYEIDIARFMYMLRKCSQKWHKIFCELSSVVEY